MYEDKGWEVLGYILSQGAEDPEFDFTMKYPSVDYAVDEKSRTIDDSSTGLASFHFGGDDDWQSGYILHYDQVDIEHWQKNTNPTLELMSAIVAACRTNPTASLVSMK